METKIIILQGPVASGKTMIASLLVEHYQRDGLTVLLLDDIEPPANQLQKLFEADYYDYILITLLSGEKLFDDPCLEKPWKTITIT